MFNVNGNQSLSLSYLPAGGWRAVVISITSMALISDGVTNANNVLCFIEVVRSHLSQEPCSHLYRSEVYHVVACLLSDSQLALPAVEGTQQLGDVRHTLDTVQTHLFASRLQARVHQEVARASLCVTETIAFMIQYSPFYKRMM